MNLLKVFLEHPLFFVVECPNALRHLRKVIVDALISPFSPFPAYSGIFSWNRAPSYHWVLLCFNYIKFW